MADRPPPADKGRLFPRCRRSTVSPTLRAEMLSVMHAMGLAVEKHHHEWRRARPSWGLNLRPGGTADNMQIYKYVVAHVGQQYGKTATFMAKPVMATRLRHACAPIGVERGSARPLPATCMPICPNGALLHRGIIHHARRDQRFHQPGTTNSYKRLIPGVRGHRCLLARYSSRNPLGGVPHPYTAIPKASGSRCGTPIPPQTPICLPRC